jgi:hypothetical protein
MTPLIGQLLPADRPWLDGVRYVEHDRDAHTLDGQPVIGVTSALQLAGQSTDFSKANPTDLERQRQVGQAAHAAAHYFDEGDLVEASVHALATARLQAWKLFRHERRVVPVMLETVVASRRYGYIGRLDRFLLVEMTRLVLGDIKIGDPDDAAAHLQLMLYLIALLEELQHYADHYPWLMTRRLETVLAGPIERWSVQLLSTGRYKLCRYPKSPRTAHEDRQDALEAVADARVLRGLPEKPEIAA